VEATVEVAMEGVQLIPRRRRRTPAAPAFQAARNVPPCWRMQSTDNGFVSSFCFPRRAIHDDEPPWYSRALAQNGGTGYPDNRAVMNMIDNAVNYNGF
jgi:hypothetical protein